MTSMWRCSNSGNRGRLGSAKRSASVGGRRRGLRFAVFLRVVVRLPAIAAYVFSPHLGALLPFRSMSRSPRVLVVEDDSEIAGALRRSLRLEGYDVRVSEDG